MSYNPESLHRAINQGLAKAVVQQTKTVSVPREKTIKDLGEYLRTEKFDEFELNFLHQILRDRCRQKTCYDCGKLQPTFKGELLWPDGDMSKPKRFRCADCRGVL